MEGSEWVGLYSQELERQFKVRRGDRVIRAIVNLSGRGLHYRFEHFQETFEKMCERLDFETTVPSVLAPAEAESERTLTRFVQIDAGKDDEVVVRCRVITDLPVSVADEIIAAIQRCFSEAVAAEFISLKEHTVGFSPILDMSEKTDRRSVLSRVNVTSGGRVSGLLPHPTACHIRFMK